MTNTKTKIGAITERMENVTAGNESFKEPILISKSAGAILAGLNIFLSITASLGNALILIALHKVTVIHPPTKLLLRCLSVTDLCVGLISQPFFAIALVTEITNTNKDLFHYSFSIYNVSGYILCAVSLMTSASISVDRLLALMLGLRYRQVVALKRVRAFIICFWLLPSASIGCGKTIPGGYLIFMISIIIIVPLSVLLAVSSYIMIYLRLRHHQHQILCRAQQAQPGGAIPLNIARYKKTVSSVAWIQLVLLACYAPFIVALALLLTMKGSAEIQIYIYVAQTLIKLNSSLNPILYCWKIREVKEAVKNTLRQLNCCFKSN